MTYIEVNNIKKVYQIGDQDIFALLGISFEIEKGEFVVIVGPSGAGKSTVMNILGGMDNPTSGEVFIDGKNITHLKDKPMTQYRRDDVGFVFQSYNLIPNLTALENVEMATQIRKSLSQDPKEALKSVGLSDRLNNFPSQLSGGEQQRVAIARAIAKNPKILLCDEPTGALDTETGKQILKVLRSSVEKGMTVVVITHNQAITQLADHVIEIKNGEVVKEWKNTNPKSVDEIIW